jgi:hypothetical protein
MSASDDISKWLKETVHNFYETEELAKTQLQKLKPGKEYVLVKRPTVAFIDGRLRKLFFLKPEASQINANFRPGCGESM